MFVRGLKCSEYIYEHYLHNEYSKVTSIEYCGDTYYYITTNYRVLVENNWLGDLKYLCEPTEHHEKRVTVKFTTQIAITREYNRHRVDSMAEQSTSYCNYGKDKFGGVNINVPDFVSAYDFDDYTLSKEWMFDTLKVLQSHEETLNAIDYWLLANHMSEYCYLQMIKLGKLAQEARTVLPLDTNSELIHTAFVKDWKHFFDLRDADSAHPDAKGLARPLHKEFIKRGYVAV